MCLSLSHTVWFPKYSTDHNSHPSKFKTVAILRYYFSSLLFSFSISILQLLSYACPFSLITKFCRKKEKNMSKTPRPTLDRNLEELESLLTDDVFLQPSETTNRKIVCKEVQRKLNFLKRLLAAEENSNEVYPPHHLQHIAERLKTIEHDYFSLSSSEGNSGNDSVDNDSSSTCLCTELCFPDDEGEGELGDGGSLTCEDAEVLAEGFEREKAVGTVNGQKGLLLKGGDEKENVAESSENIYRSFNGGNDVVNFEVGLVRQKGYGEEEKNKTRMVRERDRGASGTVWLLRVRDVALGIGIGMIFMGLVMVKFSGCFCTMDQPNFPVPT